MKNIEQDPLLWLTTAYERALSMSSSECNADASASTIGDKEWSYNWDQPECGTPQPKPRDSHGTLFLLWNGTTTPADIPAVDQVARELGLTVLSAKGDLTGRDPSELMADQVGGLRVRTNPPGFLMFRSIRSPFYQKSDIEQFAELNKMRLLRHGGPMLGNQSMDIMSDSDLYCDAKPDDPWYGPLLVAQAKTPRGLEALKQIAAKSAPGKAVLIEHVQKNTALEKGLVLRVFTGLGDDSIPEVDRSKLIFGDMLGHADRLRELATRFHLYKGATEVARCHVSYRDGINVWTIGPTIEMIETAKPHRGHGYLRVLYDQVEKHFHGIWKLRRLPDRYADGLKFGEAGQPGYILKATHLVNFIVERKRKSDGFGKELTDKVFLAECGFEINDVIQLMTPMMQQRTAGTAADEEMMKFVVTADLPKRSKDTEQKRFCENCKGQDAPAKFRHCGKCLSVVYCCRECQVEDWPFHRLWCNKKPEKILKKLIDVDLYEKSTDSDGREVLCNKASIVRSGGPVDPGQLARIYEATGIAADDPRRRRG